MKTEGARPASGARRAGIVTGAAGWVILIALAVSRLAVGAPRDTGALVAGLVVAFALVTTSAALVLLDALRHGFGALDSFFIAALARSSQRREAVQQSLTESRRRDYIGDRPFVANSDGTVTVETRLGPRHFPSLADAQDFIGF